MKKPSSHNKSLLVTKQLVIKLRYFRGEHYVKLIEHYFFLIVIYFHTIYHYLFYRKEEKKTLNKVLSVQI